MRYTDRQQAFRIWKGDEPDMISFVPAPHSLPAAIMSGSGHLYSAILVAALILLAVYLARSAHKPSQSRADRLAERYRVLDADTLNGLDDASLLDAVIANLMAKLDPKNPDDYSTVPLLSPGRCAVYSVWITCQELGRSGLAAYRQSPAFEFDELAADGLDLIGAPETGAALRRAGALDELDGVTEEDGSDSPALAEAEAALREAMEREDPLALCRAYIRANPGEFLDVEEEPPAPEADESAPAPDESR